jgi:hypothetical protein
MLETLALLTEAAALQFIDNFVDVNQDRMAIQCESYGYQACQLNMRNNEWLSGGLAVSGALFANITGVYFNMRYATAAGTLTCIVCVCVSDTQFLGISNSATIELYGPSFVTINNCVFWADGTALYAGTRGPVSAGTQITVTNSFFNGRFVLLASTVLSGVVLTCWMMVSTISLMSYTGYRGDNLVESAGMITLVAANNQFFGDTSFPALYFIGQISALVSNNSFAASGTVLQCTMSIIGIDVPPPVAPGLVEFLGVANRLTGAGGISADSKTCLVSCDPANSKFCAAQDYVKGVNVC